MTKEKLKQEIVKNKRMLFQLELQQARYSISCPPHIIMDIEDISKNINVMEKELNSLEEE